MMITILTYAVALCAAPVCAQDVLRVDAAVWDVAAEDVTGDGRAEIFLLCADKEARPARKYVAVFVPDEGGAYSSSESLRIELTPQTSALFLAECDGKPPVELVAADASGARVYGYSEGAFRQVDAAEFSSLFPSNAKEPTFLKDTAKDLDGDGVDEWIVPAPAGYDIRNAKGLLASLPCDVFSEIYTYGSVYIRHRLPACDTFTLEGVPVKGLAFLSDEAADFCHGEAWKERARYDIPVNVQEKWDASTRMADINADGFPDLVITQTKGTVNLKALTQIYIAEAPFKYPAEPSVTFETAGSIASPMPIDVNGDGKLDIVLVKVPFGVSNIVNFFVRRKVSVRVEVYLFDGAGFSTTPSFVERLLLEAPEGRDRVAYCFADFTGDGRLDVAYGESADRMVVRAGGQDTLMSSKPWVEVSIPTFGVARAFDLEGKGRKDMVLFHSTGENQQRVEVLRFGAN